MCHQVNNQSLISDVIRFFETEDDYCTGCGNVQQSYSGLRLQGQSCLNYLWSDSWVHTSDSATLYVKCNSHLHQAVLYSTKLHKHQGTWLPCEVEALSIATSVKHFSPVIIQSKNCTCVVTDGQPSVQVINKLCRGEFSADPALRLS